MDQLVETNCLFLLEHRLLSFCLGFVFKWGLDDQSSACITRVILACSFHPSLFKRLVEQGGFVLLMNVLTQNRPVVEGLLVISVIMRYGIHGKGVSL